MAEKSLVIDFGSAYTNIFMLGYGLVLSEPTVAAIDENQKGAVKCIGNDAKKIIGKTSKSTKIVFPVFEGEIVNEKVAEEVLGGFLKKIGITGMFSGFVLFSVPCGADSAMLSKYRTVAQNVGLMKPKFAEATILTALGQGLPLNDASPCFVLDMSGGNTNISALTLGGVITGLSVNLGANKIVTDLMDYVASKYQLQIGFLTAEKLKSQIGSLDELDRLSCIVNGRDLSSGIPKSILLKANDILDCVKMYYDKIAEIALTVLKKLPAEVSAEIRRTGIYVSGVGATVYGLEKYYQKFFDVKILVAENPCYSVAIGGGIAIGSKEIMKKITLKF